MPVILISFAFAFGLLLGRLGLPPMVTRAIKNPESCHNSPRGRGGIALPLRKAC